MTTAIVDLEHRKIVTDTQCTKEQLKLGLPYGLKKLTTFTHGNIKIYSYDFNTVFVAAGCTLTIQRFISNYKKGRILTVPDTCVLLVENHHSHFKVTEFSERRKIQHSIHANWITIGSGSNYACGYLEGRNDDQIDDEHRAYKAIKTASKYDIHTNDDVFVFTFPRYDDIH